MHELLVGIENMPPRVNGAEIRYRPAGRILFSATDAIKRNKWAEILCDLADPRPRPRAHQGQAPDPSKRTIYEQYAQTPIRQSLGARWDLIKEQWTPAARNRWFDCDCIPDGHPEKPIAEAFLWSEIEKTGIRTALGRDHTGVVDLLDTWLWSPHELKIHLVVTNADMTDAEAREAANVSVERVGEGRSRRTFHFPARIIQWDTDLGIPPNEEISIRDKDTVYHPRFNRPMTKNVVRMGPRPAEIDRPGGVRG